MTIGVSLRYKYIQLIIICKFTLISIGNRLGHELKINKKVTNIFLWVKMFLFPVIYSIAALAVVDLLNYLNEKTFPFSNILLVHLDPIRPLFMYMWVSVGECVGVLPICHIKQ